VKLGQGLILLKLREKR